MTGYDNPIMRVTSDFNISTYVPPLDNPAIDVVPNVVYTKSATNQLIQTSGATDVYTPHA